MPRTLTPTRRRRDTAESDSKASVRDRIRQLVADCPEIREAEKELVRLHSEAAATAAELDRAEAAASDIDNLVAKIERGTELSPSDSADRISAMKAQASAYQIAIARCERRRTEAFQSLGTNKCEEIARLHRDKLSQLHGAMTALCSAIESMSEIPNELRKFEISPGNAFPVFHRDELRPLVAKFAHWQQPYREFLQGAE